MVSNEDTPVQAQLTAAEGGELEVGMETSGGPASRGEEEEVVESGRMEKKTEDGEEEIQKGEEEVEKKE